VRPDEQYDQKPESKIYRPGSRRRFQTSREREFIDFEKIHNTEYARRPNEPYNGPQVLRKSFPNQWEPFNQTQPRNQVDRRNNSRTGILNIETVAPDYYDYDSDV
jgi:hypothetical protein